jgi:hypothetical protein
LAAKNAQMSNPQVAFIQQEIAAGIPLITVGGLGPSDPTFKLTFNNATAEQIAQCNLDAQQFNWTPQPMPDYIDFGAACYADNTLDLAHKEFVHLLVASSSVTTTVQAIYQQGVTQFGAQDPGIVTIAGYAKTYNIPVQQGAQ